MLMFIKFTIIVIGISMLTCLYLALISTKPVFNYGNGIIYNGISFAVGPHDSFRGKDEEQLIL